MMHYCFNDYRILKNKNGTNQVIGTIRVMLKNPKMGFIAVFGRSCINNIQQHYFGDIALNHAKTSMSRNDDGAVKSFTIHANYCNNNN